MAGQRYVRPTDVAFVADDVAGQPVTYLARLPDGPIAVLEGIAAVIWGEATAGEGSDVAAGVAAIAAVEVADIREDVEKFLAVLVDEGLLAKGWPNPDQGEPGQAERPT